VSDSLFPDVEAHVIDTNLFVAFERHDTDDLLERDVREHDVVLLLPSRVYEELTPANYPYGTPPVDDAIEAGWVEVLEDVDYTNPVVSATIDVVRRYIAAADDAPNTTSNRPMPRSVARRRCSSNVVTLTWSPSTRMIYPPFAESSGR
jgi:hypothetical protein